MKLLFAAAEVAPFIKTGGLADVAGSLPAQLAALGHEVKVILPLYEGIPAAWRAQMTFLRHDQISLAWRRIYCGIFSLQLGDVTYWFVDNESYFKRQNIYGYYDDGERFAFFCRAILEAPLHLDWIPDIIHCNDWQTALVPVYLLEERKNNGALGQVKSLYTIHNIAYQGEFPESFLEDVCGLPRSCWRSDLLEHFGAVNLMKGGIYAADALTTVSPTYAEELQFSFYAHGMEYAIAQNRYKLRGILNGLDLELYNPTSDSGLEAPFSVRDLSGKRACKAALQRIAGLPEEPNTPLLACVSRLAEHKGFDLLCTILPELMQMEVQLVLLGSGNWNYEESFRQASRHFPSRCSAQLRYDPALATTIYGGADLFLMPSVSEPCGLAQMIAMRYGTVPLVRETGGLKDSVPPWNSETKRGLGFSFQTIEPHDFLDAIRRAVSLYQNDHKAWQRLQRNGMTADFSWTASARAYDSIYQALLSTEGEDSCHIR